MPFSAILTVLRRYQAVTDSAFSSQKLVASVRGFNFFTQMSHIDAQILRLLFGIGSPDFAQQLFVGNDLARVLGENLKQRILGHGKFYFASYHRHYARIEVDLKRA